MSKLTSKALKILDFWAAEPMDEQRRKKIRLFCALMLQGAISVLLVLAVLFPLVPPKYLMPGYILLAQIAVNLFLLKAFPGKEKLLFALHLFTSVFIISWVSTLLPIEAIIYCQSWIVVLPLLSIFLLGPKTGFIFICVITLLGSSGTIFSISNKGSLASYELHFLYESILSCQIFAIILGAASTFFFWNMEKLEKSIKEKNQQLRSSEILLVQSAKWAAIGEIANGLAHEVNNPLFIATAHVDKLIRSQKDASQNKSLLTVKNSLLRIGQIVSSLSKSSLQEKNNYSETQSLDEIIQCALDLCLESFLKLDIEINIEGETGIYVHCQLNEIVEALVSLFHNARDAVKEEEKRIIHIQKVVENEHMAGIIVSDSGKGIVDDIKQRIFEPFFSYGREIGDGKGLGLAVARANCLKNDGKLELLKGEMTSFSIMLPRKKSPYLAPLKKAINS